MLKEIALGLSNRHNFVNSDQISDWMGTEEDVYTSLFEYDDYVKEFLAKKKSLQNYDGMLYIPEEFILDVDGVTMQAAWNSTRGLQELLNDLLIQYNTYVSGRGFHIGIPASSFKWQPEPNLNLKVKQVLLNNGIYEFADPQVCSSTQLIRLINTKNTKVNLFKSYLTKQEFLNLSKSGVFDDASLRALTWKARNTIAPDIPECIPVFDLTEIKNKLPNNNIINSEAMDQTLYPCIQSMLSDNDNTGSRHMIALRLAAWYRWRAPRYIVSAILHQWRANLKNLNKFTESELNEIIKSSYSGHAGQGNRYGCNDPIMDKHCKDTCKLWRIKKNATYLDAETMDNGLVTFQTGVRDGTIVPLKPFGTDFPIWPGEVVMIQAPPKSMKTLLLQNIVYEARMPTYFKEMEMNANQIWSRFVQMHMGWSDEELLAKYYHYRNKIKPEFDWLTMDFQSCYPYELQKKLDIMKVQPKIVVIDHIRLLKSKQRDPNVKIEEASQALTELAINNKIIVFVVSEVTKEAIREGMDVTSAKGSIGTAYNVNKLISIKPFYDKKTELIEMLKVKTVVNREKDVLNVNLYFDNYKLVQ